MLSCHHVKIPRLELHQQLGIIKEDRQTYLHIKIKRGQSSTKIMFCSIFHQYSYAVFSH